MTAVSDPRQPSLTLALIWTFALPHDPLDPGYPRLHSRYSKLIRLTILNCFKPRKDVSESLNLTNFIEP